MLELRPIVVDENNIILGGNMRYKACIEAGLKEIYILKAEDLTEQQKDEFIVKDNVGFGEWDWDILANEWDTDKLQDWGLDLPLDLSNEEFETTLGGESITENTDYILLLTIKEECFNDAEDLLLQIENFKNKGLIEVVTK
jgi:hypothetical protein